MTGKMNLTLLADFYELTMANGYWEHGIAEQIAYYDLFFRKVPDQGGFAIMAGLEQAIDYMKNRCSFRHRPHITFKLKVLQILQKRFIEAVFTA